MYIYNHLKIYVSVNILVTLKLDDFDDTDKSDKNHEETTTETTSKPNLDRMGSDDSSAGCLTPNTLLSLLDAKEYIPSPSFIENNENENENEIQNEVEYENKKNEDDKEINLENNKESQLRVDAPTFRPTFRFPTSCKPKLLLKMSTIEEIDGDDESELN